MLLFTIDLFCDDLKSPQGKTVSKKKHWEKKKTEERASQYTQMLQEKKCVEIYLTQRNLISPWRREHKCYIPIKFGGD